MTHPHVSDTIRRVVITVYTCALASTGNIHRASPAVKCDIPQHVSVSIMHLMTSMHWHFHIFDAHKHGNIASVQPLQVTTSCAQTDIAYQYERCHHDTPTGKANRNSLSQMHMLFQIHMYVCSDTDQW